LRLRVRYFSKIFRPSSHSTGPIFGGYPGFTIRRPGEKDDRGEADVLFVMADGNVGVGECKTRAADLVDSEIAKLNRLAARLPRVTLLSL